MMVTHKKLNLYESYYGNTKSIFFIYYVEQLSI